MIPLQTVAMWPQLTLPLRCSSIVAATPVAASRPYNEPPAMQMASVNG
jgi:hypothetical protein